MGCYTNRSLIWELKNSLWILFSFFLLPGFGFFYIGIKTLKMKWIVIGGIYSCVLFSGVIVIENKIVYWFYFISGVILSFYYKREYLSQLETIQDKRRQMESEKLQKQFERKYSQRRKKVNKKSQKQIAKELDEKEISTDKSNSEQMGGVENAVQNSKPLKQGKTKSLKDRESIDINLCSIDTLSELPGVTLVLAKKAVNYRKKNNGFASVEEFYNVVGLKPHIIVQISDKLICNPLVEDLSTGNSYRIGRSLDL